MVSPCTVDGVCVVCPGTSELVGQHLERHHASAWAGQISFSVCSGIVGSLHQLAMPNSPHAMIKTNDVLVLVFSIEAAKASMWLSSLERSGVRLPIHSRGIDLAFAGFSSEDDVQQNEAI